MTVKFKKNAKVVLIVGKEYTVTKVVTVVDGEAGRTYEVDAKPGILYPENNIISLEAYVDILEGAFVDHSQGIKTYKGLLDVYKKENDELKKSIMKYASHIDKLEKDLKSHKDKLSQSGSKLQKNKELLLHTLNHMMKDIESL